MKRKHSEETIDKIRQGHKKKEFVYWLLVRADEDNTTLEYLISKDRIVDKGDNLNTLAKRWNCPNIHKTYNGKRAQCNGYKVVKLTRPECRLMVSLLKKPSLEESFNRYREEKINETVPDNRLMVKKPVHDEWIRCAKCHERLLESTFDAHLLICEG